MITVKSFDRILFVLLISVSLLSCNKDLSTSSDFLIRVDSIRVPNAVLSQTPFAIEFFGTISFNGCVSFKTFNTVVNKNEFIIQAWATYNENDRTCPDVMVSLDGQKLNLTIPLPGSYYIIIKEPGGPVLSRQITVN